MRVSGIARAHWRFLIGFPILSFHPSEGIDDRSLRYLSSVFIYWKSFAHVYRRDGELILQSMGTNDSDLSRFLENEQLILTLHNPSQLEADEWRPIGDALRQDFQACQPLVDSAELFAVYYLRDSFDCALLSSPARVAVQYDNGVQLANLLLASKGAELTIETWWTILPDDAHGVSIQLFDQAGEKVAGSDFTIRHDSLSRHQLDLSPLVPGDYAVKLILYHYETRASVAGVAVNAQARFERELEIGRITIEL